MFLVVKFVIICDVIVLGVIDIFWFVILWLFVNIIREGFEIIGLKVSSVCLLLSCFEKISVNCLV